MTEVDEEIYARIDKLCGRLKEAESIIDIMYGLLQLVYGHRTVNYATMQSLMERAFAAANRYSDLNAVRFESRVAK